MNYDPIHHHQASLEPLKAVNEFYRLGVFSYIIKKSLN